ncbi:SH3 domain-containing protein [Leptolyngbya sp. AN03gr2]|uniref:SH3 domain-containing protein n=1 Tax=unclassified Leptolyngbya TaxID=2650499 RepID=UPI003D321162
MLNTKFLQAPIIISSLGALLLSVLPAMARPATVVTNANLRSSASSTAPVIDSVGRNGTVEVLNAALDDRGWTWYYVQSEIEGTENGWLRYDMVRFNPTDRTYAMLKGDRDSQINVRSAPTTTSRILHYGIGGDIVEIDDGRTQREGSYSWYWVTFPNQASGWVRGDLLSRMD